MSVIHVCSLARLEELAAAIEPSHVLSVLGGITPFPQTPAGIDPANHMKLLVADIAEPQDGLIHPDTSHMQEVIEFGHRWARESGGDRPLLVHCYAGISRSSASALTIARAVRPDKDEAKFAHAIRAASITAQPNPLMIAHADALLERGGRLVYAVKQIGMGDFGDGAKPFAIRLDV